jgi:hypothetical protein
VARVRLWSKVLRGLCWLAVVVFAGFTLPSAGLNHPPVWLQVRQLLTVIVLACLVLSARVWNRQIGLALMDKLERDFDFAWYDRYMDLVVA